MDPPPSFYSLSHAADFLEGPISSSSFLFSLAANFVLDFPPLPSPGNVLETTRAASKSCRLSSQQGEDEVVSLVGQAGMLSINIPSGVVLSQAHSDPEFPSLPFHEGCPPSYQRMRNRLISHLPSEQARACVNLSLRDTALCSQDFLSLEIFLNWERRKSIHVMSSVCKPSPTSWQWNLLAVLWHHHALPGWKDQLF